MVVKKLFTHYAYYSLANEKQTENAKDICNAHSFITLCL